MELYDKARERDLRYTLQDARFGVVVVGSSVDGVANLPIKLLLRLGLYHNDNSFIHVS